MSTLGPNFVAVVRPTPDELAAAFTFWFNNNISFPPGQLQIPNPGLIAATPLTFAQIQTLLTAASTPSTPAFATYRALISQIGTDDPEVTVLENELSEGIIWTRAVAGGYVGTLAGAFISTKTFLNVGQNGELGGTHFSLSWADEDTVALVSSSLNSGTSIYDNADDLLILTPIEILVYP